MKNLNLFLAAAPLLLCACSHTTTADNTAQQNNVINDVVTPLHLMQPQYDTPYSIPTADEVKAVTDRVLGFLEGAIPADLDETGLHMQTGTMRATSYENGVTYAACVAAALNTNDDRYLSFTQQRLRTIAELAPRIADSIKARPSFDPNMRKVVAPDALDDAGAMAAAYIHLMLSTGLKDEAMDRVIDNYVSYVHDRQYRLSDGIFARQRPHHNTVWLDDMYMGVPCLAWQAARLKDGKLMHEAVEQIGLFKQRMWVDELQLFRHGWVEQMEPHPCFPWGRANGWAILTMCEVLDAMKTFEGSPLADRAEYKEDKVFVLELLQKHIEGLARLQDKTGFWHQLLNDPDTYLETSCTAIYTYCMAHAICEGWIDDLAYGAQTLLGWQAVATQVNARGEVENTCVGTGMGFDRAFYAYRPVHVMAAHGYGPTLWAGSEIIRLLGCKHPKMNDSAIHFYATEQKTDRPIFSESSDETVNW